jgi:hypothetical protein
VQPMESSSLIYRDGWYLGGRLLPGSPDRSLEDVLDDLTREGWKVASIGTPCYLARPQRHYPPFYPRLRTPGAD